eukprot:1387070-Lingulodinium_polyedra.AAC.1
MDLHLFQAPLAIHTAGELSPKGGLFATWGSEPVFIVSAFTRWGVAQADVVVLQRVGSNGRGPSLYVAKVADLQTVPQASLHGIGVHF